MAAPVRFDARGIQNFGVVLMRRIIDYSRERGIGEIYGDVLRENETMLRLCRVLGFTESHVPDEPDIVRVSLELRGRGGTRAAAATDTAG